MKQLLFGIGFLATIALFAHWYVPLAVERGATAHCLSLQAQMKKFEGEVGWYTTRADHDLCYELGINLYPTHADK